MADGGGSPRGVSTVKGLTNFGVLSRPPAPMPLRLTFKEKQMMMTEEQRVRRNKR